MESTYLKYLGLENFRNFENKVNFNFAPITLLAGPNSSGKSTLIKAIQLFQSGIHESEGIQVLYFNEGDHHLGFFQNIINKNSFEDEVKFTFEFPIHSLFEHFLIELNYIPNPKNDEFGMLNRIQIFNDETDLILIEKSENPRDGFGWGKINFPYIIDRVSEIKGKLSSNENPNKYPFYLLDGISSTSNDFFKQESDANLNHYFKTDFDASKFLTYVQSNELVQEFKSLTYSEREQIRKIPEKHWKQGAIIQDLPHPFFKPTLISAVDICLYEFLRELHLADEGYKGIHFLVFNDYTKKTNKNTATSLTKYIIEDIIQDGVIRELDSLFERLKKIETMPSARAKESRIYQDGIKEYELNNLTTHYWYQERYETSTGSSFVNRSIQFFGIGNQLVIERNQGTTSEIFIESKRGKYLLTDLGLGTTQLITLILKIDKIGREKGIVIREAGENHRPSVLLIENPEINLFPLQQSKLAEFIMDAAEKFNIQFIIETHSVQLIQAFQKLVAQKKIPPHYLKIYIFSDPNSADYEKEAFREIQILKNGELSREFGEGFLN